jgi:hypothetical protein
MKYTERKFKVGDKVFSVGAGVFVLQDNPSSSEYCLRDPDGCTYTETGRVVGADKFRSLFTLDEARAMGFPVPAEPLVFSAEVRTNHYLGTRGGIDKEYFVQLPTFFVERDGLLGKRVNVTVEVHDV